jgi:membrane-associated two-gene conflict system component 1 (EACC1)
VASATMAVTGAPDADVALLGWLRTVPELRGRVHRERVIAQSGEQGASGDLVVALASTGAATALVTSLQVWLANRHTDVTVSVSVPDGRQVTVNAARVPDLTQVRELLSAALAEDVDPHADRSDGDGVAVDGSPPPVVR